MEPHRKVVDGESQLSDEVDQAPLPEENQLQCFLLPPASEEEDVVDG